MTNPPLSNPVPPTQGGTISRWLTSSTKQVKMSLRRMLLDFADVSGRSPRDIIGERFWWRKPPNTNTTFPYAVAVLHTRTDGNYRALRLDADLEILLHGRPTRMQALIDECADFFDQGMRTTVLIHQGLIFCRHYERQELPVAEQGGAVDSEVVTTRLVYTLAIWPDWLTRIQTFTPVP